MKTINILGSEYKITNNEKLETDGACDFYKKVIELRPIEMMLEGTSDADMKQYRYNEVMRHELIHAFLFECGYSELAYNENAVDFFAMQFPKLINLFERVNVNG